MSGGIKRAVETNTLVNVDRAALENTLLDYLKREGWIRNNDAPTMTPNVVGGEFVGYTVTHTETNKT